MLMYSYIICIIIIMFINIIIPPCHIAPPHGAATAARRDWAKGISYVCNTYMYLCHISLSLSIYIYIYVYI